MRIFTPQQHVALSASDVVSSSERADVPCTLVHDAGKSIVGLSALNDPKAGSVVYLSRARDLSLDEMALISRAGVHGIILHRESLSGDQKEPLLAQNQLEGINIFSSEKPYESFLALIPYFFHRETSSESSIHPTAIIGKNVSLGSSVSIGAYSIVGDNVSIGNETIVFPHVVIYDGVTIGSRCTLHSGVTIREFSTLGDECYLQNGATVGSDGFGYVPDPKLGIVGVPQVGVVHIGDRVDIGANSCVDRATFGTTEINTATKLDNLVQVGHNVSIGSNTLLCAQVGVGGSSRVGNQVVLGGQSGVADHVQIGDRIRVGSQSGVTSRLRETGDYLGFPAEPAGTWRRQRAFQSMLMKHSKKLLQFLKTLKA